MFYRIEFHPAAEESLNNLIQLDTKKSKKVLKTLGLMESNLRHPSLRTHIFDKLQGPKKEKVFESYVENNTPGAWRIFWYYGPEKGVITIIFITPNP